MVVLNKLSCPDCSIQPLDNYTVLDKVYNQDFCYFVFWGESQKPVCSYKSLNSISLKLPCSYCFCPKGWGKGLRVLSLAMIQTHYDFYKNKINKKNSDPVEHIIAIICLEIHKHVIKGLLEIHFVPWSSVESCHFASLGITKISGQGIEPLRLFPSKFLNHR